MHFYPPERIAMFIDGTNPYAAELRRCGSARLDRPFLGARHHYHDIELSEFLRLCGDLPEDPCCIAGNRFRRRGRLLAILGDDGLIRGLERLRADREPPPVAQVSRWLPREAVNDGRTGPLSAVAPLTDRQIRSFFLGQAIGQCLRLIGWAEEEPFVQVDVDIVRCEPLAGQPAAPLQHALASQWRPFTMGLLISREGVIGGETLVTRADGLLPDAPEKGSVQARFTVKQPWTGWIVDHRRIAHSMAPVKLGRGREKGHHTMLWVGLSRLTAESQR